MPLPLCQLPSPAGTGVVTTTPSLTACAVTFLVAALIVSAAPFVLPVNITPVEQGRKLCSHGPLLSCPSPCLVPVESLSVPALAGHGS